MINLNILWCLFYIL